MALLEIRDLHAEVDGKPILKGINLSLNEGEIHAIMGPNGSGKSTLASVLMGHPKYKVTQGTVSFDGKNVLALEPFERAKLGLFLGFQYPFEIQGISLNNFLWTAFKTQKGENAKKLGDFRKFVLEKMKVLKLEEGFAKRELNVGFSGGEKKRAEVLQMLVLEPRLAILDETDSGLDIDSLKLVAEAVRHLRSPKFTALIITHYKRILNHVEPDFVHVLADGKIIKSGTQELAHELEEKGYTWLLKEVQA